MAGGPSWGVFEQSPGPSSVPKSKGVYPHDQPRQPKKVLGQGRMRKRNKRGKPTSLAVGQGSGADTPAPLITNSTSGTVIGGPGTP